MPEETIKEMATTLISNRTKMEMSSAIPFSAWPLRIVLPTFTYYFLVFTDSD